MTGRRIADAKELGISDGKREARALKERAIIPDIGEGRDARARAASQFGLGLDQRLAKLLQRPAAERRGDEQTIGAQRAADLDERAGEIVDAVKSKARYYEIEARG